MLEVSTTDGAYRLLHSRSCISVKEADFKKLSLTIIFFQRDPVSFCGKSLCSPAYYMFGADTSNGYGGEEAMRIPYRRKSDPVIVEKRNHPYYHSCPLLTKS